MPLEERDSEVRRPSLRVVQFLHPGHEYDAARVGLRKGESSTLMPWKAGNSCHDRKYLEAIGSAVDPARNRAVDGVELGFWGEWEAPSRVRRTGAPYQNWGLPSLVHQPIWPESPPPGPRQNTDPLVFGGAFRYTNCQQDKAVMQQLAPGSMILFGRASQRRGEFRMDTCLVVAESSPVAGSPEHPPVYGNNLVSDVVTGALLSEAGGRRVSTIHYIGATPNPADEASPFSFFPAVVASESPHGFLRALVRPQGVLERLINPKHQQGIRTTACTPEEARDAWLQIVEQVVEQGLVLGTRAWPSRGATAVAEHSQG